MEEGGGCCAITSVDYGGISSSNEHQLVLIAASMKILIGRLAVGGYAGLLRVKKKSRLLVVEERFVCVMEK
jgi:hypothetical protein